VTAATELSDVKAILGHYCSLTRDAMQRYPCDWALGRYLYDLVWDYPSRIGKGIRPCFGLTGTEYQVCGHERVVT
jgi:hypothetical protein